MNVKMVSFVTLGLIVVLCGTAGAFTLFTDGRYRDLSLAGRDTLSHQSYEELQKQQRLKQDMQLMGMDEVPGKKQWERKKSPRIAVLSNMVLPGLGQLYNGRRIKVAIMVGVMTVYAGKAWLEYKRSVIRRISRDKYDPDSREWLFEDAWYNFHKENAKDYLWWSGAIWLIGMLDAYIDANLFDIRGYTPSSDIGGGGQYLTLSFEW